MTARRARAIAPLAAVALLAACSLAPRRPAPQPVPVPQRPTRQAPIAPPANLGTIPNAVPRIEPRSRYGNPPFYDVFGKRYYVLPSCVGYEERGVASWYGPGFHEDRTSTREPYDMYAMTAAHKTLPLPCYVRVTNLQNGRSIVVRVNDRGPFVNHRIIDLSYTAAAKIGMLQHGTAMVEVQSIDPAAPIIGAAPTVAATPTVAASPTAMAPLTLPPAPATAALFIQAGAFANFANAQRLAAQLRGRDYGHVFVRSDKVAGRRIFRVRIGPVRGVGDYDRIVGALARIGITDARLALN